MNIIDAHAHIASWPSLKQSKANLIADMDRHFVSRALVSNADCATFPSVENYPRRPVDAATGLKEVLDFANEHPGRIYAAAWFCPGREPGPSKRFVALLEGNRNLVKALKLHPYCERIAADDPRVEPYYALAKRLDLPVLVHSAVDEYSSIGHLAAACRAHPDLRFVGAHMELCSDHRYALSTMMETPNLYADTAWVDMPMAKRVLFEVGIDRIMFGTDAPIDGDGTLNNPMYQAFFENQEGLSEELFHRLLEGNAASFYRL